MCREQAEWIPPKQRMKQRHSADRSGMVEATGQTSGGKMAANKSTTFGSGGSAFRVSPAAHCPSQLLLSRRCNWIICKDDRYKGRQSQPPHGRKIRAIPCIALICCRRVQDSFARHHRSCHGCCFAESSTAALGLPGAAAGRLGGLGDLSVQVVHRRSLRPAPHRRGLAARAAAVGRQHPGRPVWPAPPLLILRTQKPEASRALPHPFVATLPGRIHS